MLNLDIKAAHRLVREQRAAGNDVEWQGWDIVFYRPADHAMHSVDGSFRDGKWAFANRVVVNSEGIWEVDPRNVKRIRRFGPRR
jgi:hypothetical protein